MTAIALCDVGPQDGLQNESMALPPPARAELCERLDIAGLRRIEAVSFVRDDRVPQMAGAEEVLGALDGPVRDADVSALVLNPRGLDRALAAGVRTIHVAVTATEAFARERRPLARRGRRGAIRAHRPRRHAGRDGGRRRVRVRVPVRGHDTRNTAVANPLGALDAGATLSESPVGGARGCPFAPGATGNLATEDLAWVLEREGVETGVEAVVKTAHWLEQQLERTLRGALSRPGCSLTGM